MSVNLMRDLGFDEDDPEVIAARKEAQMTEVTEAQVEAAAEAVHGARGFDDWGAANEDERTEATDIARAALEAAHAAAPVVDLKTIERAIQQVMDCGDWSVSGYANAAYEVMQGTWDFEELDDYIKEEAERLEQESDYLSGGAK